LIAPLQATASERPSDAVALTTWIGWALVFEYATTLAHHVYGGLAYRAPERLVIALIMTIALGATLALLRRYRTQRSRNALALFSGVVLVVWVLMLGLFEGGYNHAYKNLLYLAGVSPALASKLHPNLMPGDYIYPPNDAVFELTGVLQLVGALIVLTLMVRLVRDAVSEAG
jgi:hypothetical protein